MRAKVIYQHDGREHPNVKPLEVYGNTLLLEGNDGGGGPHVTVTKRLYIRHVPLKGFEFRITINDEWIPLGSGKS